MTAMPGLSKRRLLDELRRLQVIPGLRRVSPSSEVLVFEVSLNIEGEPRYVRLTLPPAYPAVPPELQELDSPQGTPIVPADSLHRFPNGTICLFPHGNDSQAWRPDRRAVEAIGRYRELVGHEKTVSGGRRGGVWWDPLQVVLPPGIAAVMLVPGSWGRLRLRGAASGVGALYADAFESESPEQRFEAEIGEGWRAVLPREIWVPWFDLDPGCRWENMCANRADLGAWLREKLPNAVYERVRNEVLIVLARPQGERLDGCDAVHFRRPPDAVDWLLLRPVEVGDLESRLFHRNREIIGGGESLAAIRAVLIGLGSLGGAVALALARAGIKRFLLIDPDHLAIENVCRHVANLRAIGQPKVEAVRDLILGINPDAEVQVIAKHLAWDLPDFGAGVELERELGEREVLVCTCAVGTPERQLNALAVQRGLPVIFGAALGAAEHARVFRVLPGETPCYECVLRAQSCDPGRYPRFVSERAPQAEAPYLDPSLPGLAIDVTQIAMLIARLTLQTIARRWKLDLGLGLDDERGDHLLWSNRGGWAACDRALQVALCEFPRDDECPVCGGPGGRAGEPLAVEEEAELEDLLASVAVTLPR